MCSCRLSAFVFYQKAGWRFGHVGRSLFFDLGRGLNSRSDNSSGQLALAARPGSETIAFQAQGFACRSYLNTPCYHDIAEHMTHVEYKFVLEVVKANFAVAFSARASLCIENVKMVRCSEKRLQENKTVSYMRRWLAPVQRKTLGKVFQYPMVDYKKLAVRDLHLKKKGAPLSSWFKTPKKKVWGRLKDIMGYSKSPGWATFNAASQRVQYGDMALIRHCHRNNTWARSCLGCACVARQLRCFGCGARQGLGSSR